MTRNKTSNTSRRAFLRGSGAAMGSAAMLAGLNSAASAQGSEPVVIGCPLPLTGAAAADGIEIRRGIEMATQEINEMGGILGRPLEPVFVNTESQGDATVVQACQRLIDRDGASLLLTGYNLETGTAMHDVAADGGVLAMHVNTVAVHDELVKSDPDRYWGTFQYCPPETFYGLGLLNFVKNLEESGRFTRPNDKLAIITAPGTYSGNIANALNDNAAEFGFDVSLFETVTAPISEWGPTLAKLREDPPALIAVTHFYAQDQAQFMNQFMTNPTNSLIYLQYGASLAAFREIAGENANGALYSSTIAVLQDQIGQTFFDNYMALFGENSSPNGGFSYLALHAYAVAAALAGGPGAPYEDEQNRDVADRLKSLIYRGPMGTLRFVPETLSAYSYPSETDDPSLGMPHVFNQVKDYTKTPPIIAPWPYETDEFETPPWMKS